MGIHGGTIQTFWGAVRQNCDLLPLSPLPKKSFKIFGTLNFKIVSFCKVDSNVVVILDSVFYNGVLNFIVRNNDF